MASEDYVRGEMQIEPQKNMYDGVMKASMWGAVILMMAVGHSVLTLSLDINWMISLVLTAGFGLAVGLFMGFGTAWIATVVVLAAVAVFVQVIVLLFGALL
ncbi:MAG: aa3-type cytochrome c oxidase subunit IV [Pseudomonadota bacterium]